MNRSKFIKVGNLDIFKICEFIITHDFRVVSFMEDAELLELILSDFSKVKVTL
jgi:hypothetical protein